MPLFSPLHLTLGGTSSHQSSRQDLLYRGRQLLADVLEIMGFSGSFALPLDVLQWFSPKGQQGAEPTP